MLTTGGFGKVQAALFVDFDNVYINLEQQDGQTANQFATCPDKWLDWLQQVVPMQDDSVVDGSRRFIIRRCYLNPQVFGHFRPYFIRAGFEVIDCPPLTTRGKTSTDIHMVMDIMDTVNASTHVGEFFILSGDADFAPVLLRLRKHARYSVILSVGYVSPAYKSSSDHVIPIDAFTRDGLGITYQEEETSVRPVPKDVTRELLRRMSARLLQLASIPGGVQASDLPAAYREFPEFRQGNNWLGYNSLRALTEALISQRNDLAIVEEDPWRVIGTPSDAQTESELTRTQAKQQPMSGAKIDRSNVVAALGDLIRSVVQRANSAVPMATLAQIAVQRLGNQIHQPTQWLGAGSFKDLLAELDLNPLQISTVTPGYVYDPSRHVPPSPATAYQDENGPTSPPVVDNFALEHPDVAPLALKVHQLTDTPYLMPEHYAILLKELAREINESGYQLTRTSKRVRDRSVEKGAPVARSHVNFVLIGISHSGYRLGENLPEDPRILGQVFVQNTINLCRGAQFEPSQEDNRLIEHWIFGGLEPSTDTMEPLSIDMS